MVVAANSAVMPTDLKDLTSERTGETSGVGVRRVLKYHGKGTVCFPLGASFGCGTDKELGVEKEDSLELKLGGDFHGLGLELTLGTKTTKTEKWTIKAEKCEWCKPEMCFPDSRLEVWNCQAIWTAYLHSFEKTSFYPGPTGEMHKNCRVDPQRCDCRDALATFTGGNPASAELSAPVRPAAIATPVQFARTTDEPASDKGMAPVLELYQGAVNEMRAAGETPAFGVANPDGSVNWIQPWEESAPPAISLLSRNCADPAPARAASVMQGRFLPLLAIAAPVPDASAVVSATVRRPEVPHPRMPEPEEITGQPTVLRMDHLTLIWHEFDFAEPLPHGTRINVRLALLSDEGRTLASLHQPYVVVT
jgi:hypothetical protein